MQSYIVALSDTVEGDAFPKYIEDRFSQEGFGVERVEASQTLLIVDLSEEKLLTAASKFGIKKETKRGLFREFDFTKRKLFKNADSPDFLFPCEKQFLIGESLINLKVDDAFLSLVRKSNHSMILKTDPLLSSCIRLNLIDFHTPKHDLSALRSIWKTSRTTIGIPVEKIRDYFGEQVAFYWAWMSFYTLCLLLPGIIGGGIFVYNTIEGYSVAESAIVPLYSLYMVLWSATFLKLWRRKATALAYDWGTWDNTKTESVRPDFKGIVRKSPITGRDELYYPNYARIMKYLVSAVVTAVLLTIAFGVMILSLNLQGYVVSRKSYFFVPAFARLAEKGALFDPQSMIMCYVPVVAHVVTIQILNRIYRHVAENLTVWENHKTEESFESSLILKRFCFEAFDCYVAIFYLAFIECDIYKVRLELTSLYTIDCLRRVGTELILPILLQTISGKSMKKDIEKLKTRSGEKVQHEQAIRDLNRDEYEEFDDYLEMVIAFGYITMFASAFPFAAFVQIVYNLIEMKSDVYKLCFVVRRPRVIRTSGIGTWQMVMQTQAWISLITNLLMYTITSDHLLPWCSTFSIPEVKCFYVSLILLEHFVGVAVLGILEGVSDISASTDIRLKRQKFLQEEEWKEHKDD